MSTRARRCPALLLGLPSELLLHAVRVGSLSGSDVLALRHACGPLYRNSGAIFGDAEDLELVPRAIAAADALGALASGPGRESQSDARAVREAAKGARTGEERLKAYALANKALQLACVRTGAAKGKEMAVATAAFVAAPAWFRRLMIPLGVPGAQQTAVIVPVQWSSRADFKRLARAEGGRGDREEEKACEAVRLAGRQDPSLSRDLVALGTPLIEFEFGRDCALIRCDARIRTIMALRTRPLGAAEEAWLASEQARLQAEHRAVFRAHRTRPALCMALTMLATPEAADDPATLEILRRRVHLLERRPRP